MSIIWVDFISTRQEVLKIKEKSGEGCQLVNYNELEWKTQSKNQVK